jgi:hemerythrin
VPNPMEQSREGHLSIAPWSERYETGIGILDLQHQELFEFIETLAASFREGAATQKIRLALKFLASYTVNHFKTEEAFMKEMGYPSFMAHVAEHSQLFAKVRHFQTSLMEGEAITMEVAAFLADWFHHHIEDMDMDYVRFARAQDDALALARGEAFAGVFNLDDFNLGVPE